MYIASCKQNFFVTDFLVISIEWNSGQWPCTVFMAELGFITLNSGIYMPKYRCISLKHIFVYLCYSLKFYWNMMWIEMHLQQ